MVAFVMPWLGTVRWIWRIQGFRNVRISFRGLDLEYGAKYTELSASMDFVLEYNAEIEKNLAAPSNGRD